MQQHYTENLKAPNYQFRRKIVIEDVFQETAFCRTVTRKISCEESYGNGRNGGLQITGCSTETPERTSKDTVKAVPAKSEETPMEVDRSNDNLVVEEVEEKEASQVRNRALKIRHLSGDVDKTKCASNITESVLKPINRNNSKLSLRIQLVLLAFCISVLFYMVLFAKPAIFVNKKVLVERIQKDLRENVLHQEEAVTSILHLLDRIHTWGDQVKILSFVGTSGVGKTFTTNLIKRHFPPQLVHEAVNAHLLKGEELRKIFANLNGCCCNLVLMDDLRASDLPLLFDFVENVPAAIDVLLIAVFNVQDTRNGLQHFVRENDFKQIYSELDRLDVHRKVVVFDSLKYEAVEGWLRGEMRRRKIGEEHHDHLVKQLLDKHELKYRGLKGLKSKLDVLNSKV